MASSLSDVFKWDRESNGWYARHKLSNGQYCMIGLYRFHMNRATCYSVAFAVADKKKNLSGWFESNKNNTIEQKMTGRCGIEALLWCRDRLLDFERFVSIEKNMDTKIIVQGSDSKRFRLYEKVLSKYGYKKVFIDAWSMVKTLERKEDD